MSDDPDISKAVQVETSTRLINHWELGRLFGEFTDEEQFLFLHGMATSFDDMGGNAHLQNHYIARHLAANPTHGMDVKSFVRTLNDYINPEES